MKFKSIIITIISLIFTWLYGLYLLFYKNDETMVVIIPIFSYLILRRPKKDKRQSNL
jgi:hypothetical protein